MNDYIKQSFVNEQKSGLWFKSKIGYTFIRVCNQTNDSCCKTKWLFKVSVSSGRADLYFNKQCDHVKYQVELNNKKNNKTLNTNENSNDDHETCSDELQAKSKSLGKSQQTKRKSGDFIINSSLNQLNDITNTSRTYLLHLNYKFPFSFMPFHVYFLIEDSQKVISQEISNQQDSDDSDDSEAELENSQNSKKRKINDSNHLKSKKQSTFYIK